MYAMVDRDDDLKIGVKSTAILFGELDRVAIAMLQVFLLLMLYSVGRRTGMHVPYLMGLGVAAALCVYQQYLISGRDRAGCFAAFLNNHWLGAAVFTGLALDYAVR
jgi:4-hydroxybenzoate polyprenyltransferase